MCVTQTTGCGTSHKYCTDASVLLCSQLQNCMNFWWPHDNYNYDTNIGPCLQTNHTEKISVVQHSLHTWSVFSGKWRVLTSELMLSLEQKTLCSEPAQNLETSLPDLQQVIFHDRAHWLLLPYMATVPLVCKICCSHSWVSDDSGFMGREAVWLDEWPLTFWRTTWPWRCRHYDPLKCWELLAQ
jgi:hypothetical protein